jgi:hypothetical protein
MTALRYLILPLQPLGTLETQKWNAKYKVSTLSAVVAFHSLDSTDLLYRNKHCTYVKRLRECAQSRRSAQKITNVENQLVARYDSERQLLPYSAKL